MEPSQAPAVFSDERKITYLNVAAADHPLTSPVSDETLAAARAYRKQRMVDQIVASDCDALLLYDPINIRYVLDVSNMQIWMMTQWVYEDGTQIMIGFGPDHSVCRIEDLAWVQEQVDRIIPGYEVLAVNAHDWLSDEFSQGTWASHRPHWWTKYQAAMQEPEGRVILASSDIANGWAGFMDGAMESGIRAGRWAAAHC